MEAKELLRNLDDFYKHIKKKAKSGGDLFTSFKEYRDLVLENWPKDLPDNGNWISEMESVLSFIEKKKDVIHLSKSSSLKSFRDDAAEAILSINMKFRMHLKVS